MKEAHTYDMHRAYGITKKVCWTTTDSGSDFVKAFSVFGRQESKTEEDAVATTTPHQLLLPPMTLHVGDITGASATRCSWSPTTDADHGRRPRGGHSRSEAVLAGSVCQDVGAVEELRANFIQGFATPQEAPFTPVTATIATASLLGRECLRTEDRDILPYLLGAAWQVVGESLELKNCRIGNVEGVPRCIPRVLHEGSS